MNSTSASESGSDPPIGSNRKGVLTKKKSKKIGLKIDEFKTHQFYRRFIKHFSKIAKPLSNLLVQGAPLEFDDQCLKAFFFLKQKLVSTPDWNLPFELMCDVSDYAIGAVLCQKKGHNISGYLLCEPNVE